MRVYPTFAVAPVRGVDGAKSDTLQRLALDARQHAERRAAFRDLKHVTVPEAGHMLHHDQPEAVALLSCWVIERAREGRSVADLMDAGRRVLGRGDVMEGVPELVAEVQVEATFPDGRKLVTLHEPIA